MGMLDTLKDLFTNYEDEDYVSDYIIDNDEDIDDNFADTDEKIQDYSMKTFTEPASRANMGNWSKANNKEVKMMENANTPRLVNFNDVNSQRVVIIKPLSLEDGQAVAKEIRAGRICIVNFEDTDTRLAQRIIDFLTGSTYSLGGSVSPVSSLIFVVAPLNVTVSENTEEDDEKFNTNSSFNDYSDLKKVVNGLY